jgi:hypothetical protein
VRDGGVRVQKFSAVGKGIRRDVDDAHDERRARKTEFKLAGAEKHLLGRMIAPAVLRRKRAFTRLKHLKFSAPLRLCVKASETTGQKNFDELPVPGSKTE